MSEVKEEVSPGGRGGAGEVSGQCVAEELQPWESTGDPLAQSDRELGGERIKCRSWDRYFGGITINLGMEWVFLGNRSGIEKYNHKKIGLRFTVKTVVHQNENSRQRGNRKFGDGDGTLVVYKLS